MNDGKSENESDFESVWEPIIRIEATFHPAPGFEYLKNVPLGECEAVPMEPMISVAMDLKPVNTNGAASPVDFIEDVLLRPRMFCPDVETLRDLLVFVQGVCCGQRPPHGAGCTGDFTTYVNQRFNQLQNTAWTTTLLNEFSNRPLSEACEAIVRVLRDWRKSKA